MRLLKCWQISRRPADTEKTASPRCAGWMGAVAISLAALAPVAGAAPAQAEEAAAFNLSRPEMRRVSGSIMWDYSRLTLTNGGAFDLMGVHYMQQANDWLSYGIGAFAPAFRGDYGGFFGADITLQAQRRIHGNWFANAGLAVGIGAGGASVQHIKRFSGTGIYSRAYVGIGYHARLASVGVNISRVAISGSPINSTALNVFVQRPLSFSVGSYADAGRTLSAADPNAPQHENIISVGANNFRQINPTGSYQGDIGVVSTQFSHFHNRHLYSFFGVDIGFAGLLWYNQAHGGIGGRFALSRNVNLYAQLGIGSGGWVTDTIDTGPGFIIYPRVSMEYMWNNGVGATLSAGYLFAPLGTSRNWTVGLGLNYHLSHRDGRATEAPSGHDYTLRGFRVNTFARRTSSIYYNGRSTPGLTLAAVQVDYALNDNWYVAGQLAVAATAFRGFAGYAEGFAGLGWQRNLTRSGRLQGYAQVLLGGNDLGVDPAHETGMLLYPAVGFNYMLNNRVSLYGQLGATVGLGHYITSPTIKRFENYSVGFGVSYRFSLPTRS